MENNSILYKKTEPILVVSLKKRIDSRNDLFVIFAQLASALDSTVDKHLPIAVFHGGAVKEGYLVEVCFPTEMEISLPGIQTNFLPADPVLSMIHYGSHQTIRETVLKIYEYLEVHASTSSLFRREIYHKIDPSNPEKNITVIQIVLHPWDELFIEGFRKEFGSEASEKLTRAHQRINVEDHFDQFVDWIQNAIDHLDTIAVDEDQKCRVVSQCAHVFPQERIDMLRDIYLADGIDAVLEEMYKDHFWYEKPIRHGNVILMRKNPYDPEGYQNGTTAFERRKAYCHCSFVHPFLEEIPSKLSTSFCYCGAGWYTRLWQGILGKPVGIRHVETLLRGNDQCTLEITLPLDLIGDFPKVE